MKKRKEKMQKSIEKLDIIRILIRRVFLRYTMLPQKHEGYFKIPAPILPSKIPREGNQGREKNHLICAMGTNMIPVSITDPQC